MSAESPYKAEDYMVGWICALPEELAASASLLDERHPDLPQDVNDHNSYIFGRIGQHNVVIGCLPAGRLGPISATSVAEQMKASFKSIRFGLMVGIGSGIPTDTTDIRLGDVVVSEPQDLDGGVIQYESRLAASTDIEPEERSAKFIRTGSLNSPPSVLLTALTKVQAAHFMEELNFLEYVTALGQHKPKFKYPAKAEDNLFQAGYAHVRGSCKNCSKEQLIHRDTRDSIDPVVHYGTIASSNQIIKNGEIRDQLSNDLDGVICLEREAAGLMNNFPCLVIRGITDYADSHDNSAWKFYAAGTAAAFSKELLQNIAPIAVNNTLTLDQAMKDLAATMAQNTATTLRVERHILSAEEERIVDWLSPSSVNFSTAQNAAHGTQTTGTGQWLLEDSRYLNWRDSLGGLLWIHGAAGRGKTILCSTIIHDLQEKCKINPSNRLGYWYFQFSNLDAQNICNMIRSLIIQLASSLTSSTRALWARHKDKRSEPSFEELTRALEETIKTWNGQIFIILDALDECPLADRISGRPKLMGYLTHLLELDKKKLGLAITSRREPDILKTIPTLATSSIAVDNKMDEDISTFIIDALQTRPNLRRWPLEVHLQVLSKLSSGEEKQFRWAELQIKRLEGCKTRIALQDALSSTPRNLEETYQETLQKIPIEDQEKVRKILMWLTSAFRPLKTIEVAAVAGYVFPEDVLSICTSLLVTMIDDVTSNTIKLAHFSVKEYLTLEQMNGEEHHWYRFSSQLAHKTVATMALEHLLDPQNLLHVGIKPLDKPPLRYSGKFWAAHAVVASKSGDFSGLETTIMKFFSPDHSQFYENWLKTQTMEGFWTKREHRYPSAFYMASFLGLTGIAMKLFQSERQLNVKEGLYWNALTAAAVKGNIDIVDWLIQCCPDSSEFIHLDTILVSIEDNAREIMELILDSTTTSKINADSYEQAAGNRTNGVEILPLLLSRRKDLPITEMTACAAAGNIGCGIEIMKLLFEQKGEMVPITAEVLTSGARNTGETMQLLLHHSKGRVPVDEYVLSIAAANLENGHEVLKVLLDFEEDVEISEKIFLAAARNWISGQEVMSLLFGRLRESNKFPIGRRVTSESGRSNQIEATVNSLAPTQHGLEKIITAGVITTAVKNRVTGAAMLKLMRNELGADLPITQEAFMIAAENHSADQAAMKIFFDQCNRSIRLTPEILKAIIATKQGKRNLMQILNGQGLSSRVYQEVFRFLGGRRDLETWTLFLQSHIHHCQITQNILKVISLNRFEFISKLLDSSKEEVQITEELVASLAGEMNSLRTVQLFFEIGNNAIPVTERALITAATNIKDGKEMMLLLLGDLANEPLISPNVVELAAANSESGIPLMKFLLDRGKASVHITSHVLEAVAANQTCGSKLMQMLLDQRGDEVITTEDILKTIMENQDSGPSLIKLLIERRGWEVILTEGIVMAAAHNMENSTEAIQLLLDHHGEHAVISDDIIALVAEHLHHTVMQRLLDQSKQHVRITGRVLVAATKNKSNMLALLLDQCQDNQDCFTEEVMAQIAGCHRYDRPTTSEITRKLLEAQKHVPITERVMEAVAGNPEGAEIIRQLLEYQRNSLPLIETVLIAAAKNVYQGLIIMETLLDIGGNALIITEALWVAVASNHRQGDIILKALLQNGHNICVTEKILRAAASNHDGDQAMAMLDFLLDHGGRELHVVQDILMDIAQNSAHEGSMKLLFNCYRGEIVITNSLVIALAQNSRDGECLLWMLTQGVDDISIKKSAIIAAIESSLLQNKMQTIEVLFNREGQRLSIDDRMIQALSSCSWSSNLPYSRKLFLKLFLQYRGSLSEDEVYKKMLLAVSASHIHDTEMMTTLLDQLGVDYITDSVIRAAATSGHSSKLELLERQYGIAIHFPDWLSICKFFESVQNGDNSSVSRFLRFGIPSDIRDTYNRSALWWSVANGHTTILQLLVKQPKVDINVKCSITGRTPIFLAISKQYFEMAALLLSAGANPTIADEHGQTAISLIDEKTPSDIVHALRSYEEI